ncbi:MAG: hypothetical protein JNK72_07900 [Myxococcales bacterium]|nr:hypothetical protein [Myxococcales bacterium]
MALDELAKADLAQRQIDVELAEIESGLSALREAVNRIGSILAQERRDIEAAERLRASHLADLEGIAEKSQRSSKLRDGARNARELEATQRALEELKRQKEERTAEAARLEAQITDTRTQIARHETEFAALNDELKAETAQSAERSAALQESRKESQAARNKLSLAVAADLRGKYEMVFRRRGSAVAEVQQGICRACNMGIPPQLYNQVLGAERVYQCPSCQRFLLPPSITQPSR